MKSTTPGEQTRIKLNGSERAVLDVPPLTRGQDRHKSGGERQKRVAANI